MNVAPEYLLHGALERAAADHPERVAVVFGAQHHSYRSIDRRADQLAAALRDGGVRRGDRVAVYLENSVESVVAIHAALKLGAVFIPTNPLTKSDKLAYMWNDARCTAVVTESALRAEWAPALRTAATVAALVIHGPDGAAPSEGQVPGSPGARLLRVPDADSAPAPRVSESATIDQDLAGIIYTSGSTGAPKGVMLTHLNMVSAARSISTYLELRADDRILCVLPLAFDYGLYQAIMAIRMGATLVLERSFMFPVQVLETMVRERVTVLPGVPTMFSMLLALKSLPQYDLAAVRTVTNTAAALPDEHIRRLRSLVPHARLYSMYGLTECKRVTYLPPEQLDLRPGSVGRGMPNEEVWLVDDSGRRLPNGSSGELVIRGSNVMRGYWEKPQETAQRLRPGPNAGELLLYSGDIFRTDSEGWLYFVARKDDIIKSRGEKVSPREVENVLYALPGVIEAAVVGVPDPVLGEAVKAFVVLDPAHAYSEREVIRFCSARLENYMAPKFVSFVATLPRTDTGKIRKLSLA